MVILGDDLVEGENNASDIVTLRLRKAAGLADTSSTIEGEDKDVICFRIDEEIPRGNILMDNPELKIQVVYHI